ncbi:MAG: sterol desaturase family protein [Bacteroidota bacterium]|jgi:sterol desaturase/sphingolipid hydroxylase (fatty acid hydroxylase superfamily)
MEHYISTFLKSFSDYGNYLWSEILHPHWGNYFYWLIGLSLVVWGLELLFPWRKEQKAIRQDFWLDVFYMFFNFFLFSLVVFNGVSNVGVALFNDFIGLFGLKNIVAFEIGTWPAWLQLLTLFIVRDFVQWNVHRLLHRVPWLWEFHKVHHSVQQMGFAAHLRYHWMETIVYRTLEYIPLAIIGFGIDDFLLVHLFTIAIGHLNHANIYLPLGPLKYILNSPQMHIWHHAEELPEKYRHGMNFGITLSLWDYLFGTASIPKNGRDIPLGFERVKQFPKGFFGQMLFPFRRHKH